MAYEATTPNKKPSHAEKSKFSTAIQSSVLGKAYGLPFVTMLMDKSVVEKQHPSYIDMLWTSQFGSESVLNIVV
jgi:TPP-dependent 2-oxoacid decarboxylase